MLRSQAAQQVRDHAAAAAAAETALPPPLPQHSHQLLCELQQVFIAAGRPNQAQPHWQAIHTANREVNLQQRRQQQPPKRSPSRGASTLKN